MCLQQIYYKRIMPLIGYYVKHFEQKSCFLRLFRVKGRERIVLANGAREVKIIQSKSGNSCRMFLEVLAIKASTARMA